MSLRADDESLSPAWLPPVTTMFSLATRRPQGTPPTPRSDFARASGFETESGRNEPWRRSIGAEVSARLKAAGRPFIAGSMRAARPGIPCTTTLSGAPGLGPRQRSVWADAEKARAGARQAREIAHRFGRLPNSRMQGSEQYHRSHDRRDTGHLMPFYLATQNSPSSGAADAAPRGSLLALFLSRT